MKFLAQRADGPIEAISRGFQKRLRAGEAPLDQPTPHMALGGPPRDKMTCGPRLRKLKYSFVALGVALVYGGRFYLGQVVSSRAKSDVPATSPICALLSLPSAKQAKQGRHGSAEQRAEQIL
jgi:hypothetical protein